MIRILPLLAATSGFAASIEAGIPTDPGTIEALGRWPLTVILGAVCVVCVYFMYRQNQDNSNRNALVAEENCRTYLKMAEDERATVEKLFEKSSVIAKELAESHARVLREAAESHQKEVRMLLDEIVQREKPCST